MPGGPVAQEATAEIEEVLTALSGSGTLGLLGMSTADLQSARTDSALFETLRITHHLLVALRDGGVLGTFLVLSKDNQANFVRWIAGMDGEDVRQERIRTFIAALKEAPLAENARYESSE